MGGWLAAAQSRVFEEASDALGTNVAELCEDTQRLKTTRWAQPAIITVSIAGAHYVADTSDTTFIATTGHSIGEYAALAIADSLSTTEAVRLAAIRGAAMQHCAGTHTGTMAAISGIDNPREFCYEARVSLAAINEPGQFTVAGTHDAIHEAVAEAQKRGGRATKLKVAGAFHSSAMADAAAELQEALGSIPISTPSMEFWSTTTATQISQPTAIKQALVDQLTSPVLFAQTITAMNSRGHARFVDTGPGRVVATFVRKTLGAANISVVEIEDLSTSVNV